ncbi:MAG: DUF3800 domain-containing protein [Terriglobales bacterium]
MAHLYAYFDESGTEAEHPIVSLCGFIDGFQPWVEFYGKWNQLLRQYEIPALHAVRALRFTQQYGTMKPGSPEERIKEILPFIHEITNGLEMGISIAVDVNAYKSIRELHGVYGRDPFYFAFYVAVITILRHFEIPRRYQVGLIFDEEEAKAIQCYKFLTKLKQTYPEVKERIVSICFSDDKAHPQLQAADLFAYITRLEALSRFVGKAYQFRELFLAFQKVSPETGRHLHFAGGFYEEQALSDFLKSYRREIAKDEAEAPTQKKR